MADFVSVPLADLASLAVEHWRLQTALQPILDRPQLATARHALRKIEALLKAHHLEAQHLTGLPYDAGLSANVVERIPDPTLPKNTQRICETLSPLLLHNNAVLRPAEIVVAHAP
jgi:hypothetical protein